MKSIAFFNNKGGVAKTTTVINVGYILAEVYLRKVLIIDCDGQQNASRFLADEIKEVGIEKALTDASVSPRSSISKTRYKNMDILTSTSFMNSSSEIFKELSTDIQKSNLRKLNEYWKDEYDYILIDMPPALNYLTESIISTTDGVIVPVELGTFAIQGIAAVTDTINKVGASFTGCFISKYDKNNKTEHELKELLISSLNKMAKLQYIIITAEQLKILKDNYIKFAYFEKDDKYNIAFLPTQTEVIKKLIFSKSNSEENEAKRNNRIYSQLKAAAAQSGEKLKYKTKLSASQLSLLKNSKIKFAYFACKENKELFNTKHQLNYRQN